jgi:hypothetical protein
MSAGDPTISLYDFDTSDQVIHTKLSASAGSGAMGVVFVYQSNEAGQADIYVRDFVADQTPAHGLQKIKISAAGGRNPRWHGGSIYFLQGTSLMRVTVQPGTPFQVSAAQLVMELRPSGLFPYDVLPDGGFIVNSVVETAVQSAPPMRVVLNWRSWLKK